MPIDLDQLEADARIANDKAGGLLVAILDFRNGKVAGQNYTAGQKTALRSQFDADAREVQSAADAIVAQLDAN